eukprot:11811804-Alexandrium_andersonii.AAC.1
MGRAPEEDVWDWRRRHTHAVEASWSHAGLTHWNDPWLINHWTWLGHVARSTHPILQPVASCRSIAWKRSIQIGAGTRRGAWCGHFGKG